MTPDDPRHGSRAGSLAHYRAGQKPCSRCDAARFRTEKAARLLRSRGERRLVPLGEEAWTFVANPTASREQLSRATGISLAHLSRLTTGGPLKNVRATTRDALLVAAKEVRVVTPIGLQRRLQALSALGWSMKVVAARIDVWPSALCELRRRKSPKTVKSEFRNKVIAAYSELSMQIPPAGQSASETRDMARRAGYIPPLAWEDETIDDPDAKPVGLTGRYIVGDYIDHAAVLRRMAGERVDLTKAERIEVVRRLRSTGWTFSQIEEHTGLKTDRYITREKAAA